MNDRFTPHVDGHKPAIKNPPSSVLSGFFIYPLFT